MDSIGKALLEKRGWREGLGLGKNTHGISTHVRVSRKNDCTGIGISKDKSQLWNQAYWENMYNRAVQKHNSKSEEQSKSSNTVFNGMFVRSDSSASDDTTEDDDIRTAKIVSGWSSSSARQLYHGRVCGKLQRIELQDKKFHAGEKAEKLHKIKCKKTKKASSKLKKKLDV